MNEGTDKKVVTKQVIIDTKYSSKLLPITADEKVIDIIQSALTELAEIKQRAESKRKELGDIFTEANADNPYSIDGDDNVTYYTETEVIDLIDYIIKGEKK